MIKAPEEQSLIDKKQLEVANPVFAQKTKQRLEKQESLFQESQFKRKVKIIQDEQRTGLKVSKVSPDIQKALEVLK